MRNEKKILTCVGIGVIALVVFGWNDTARLAQAQEEATAKETKQEIVIDRSEYEPEITPAKVMKTYTVPELLGTEEIDEDRENADSERARTYGTDSNSVAGYSEVPDTAESGTSEGDASGDGADTGTDTGTVGEDAEPYTGSDADIFNTSGDGEASGFDSGDIEVDGEGCTETATESEPDSGVDESGYAEQSEELTYLGDWVSTGYCACSLCCGEWASGYTASGTLATEGRTVACGSLPMGTEIYIEGYGYRVVEDLGVDGEWVDIFYQDHAAASAHGMQYVSVYLVN